MDTKAFEAALSREGYSQIETKGYAPGHQTAEHAHEFDVRALVLEGDITLRSMGEAKTYRPGDVFAIPAEQIHTETIGASGVRFLYGRRG
ncbi:MAG: cupin domain-containing protein [Alphaproteobacteria bacterium]|nr:cupin domain-containing protein [Alphaproteobacteria bacterium]